MARPTTISGKQSASSTLDIAPARSNPTAHGTQNAAAVRSQRAGADSHRSRSGAGQHRRDVVCLLGHDHLPEDVRRMLSGPRRIEAPVATLCSVDELVAAVIAEGGILPAVAEPATRAVLGKLRVDRCAG